MLQKLLFSCFCFSLLTTFSGCTDGEIVASSIVVGGILIGSAINDRDDHYHRPHRDHGYPGSHGHGHHPGGNYHGGRHHDRYYYYKSAGNAEDLSEIDLAFASKYQLTTEQSMAFIDAIYALEKGDFQATYQLGFSEESLKQLAQGKLVDADTINQISLNMNVVPAKVELILADFHQVITEQMKNVKSDYWQKCMASGKWKTNYNYYCKDVKWSGCSPDSLPEKSSVKYVACFAQ